eukprot:Pgem_evm1s16345
MWYSSFLTAVLAVSATVHVSEAKKRTCKRIPNKVFKKLVDNTASSGHVTTDLWCTNNCFYQHPFGPLKNKPTKQPACIYNGKQRMNAHH